jgi:hypothetical protein
VVSVTPRPLFTSGERAPGWIEGWVGLRDGLDKLQHYLIKVTTNDAISFVSGKVSKVFF